MSPKTSVSGAYRSIISHPILGCAGTPERIRNKLQGSKAGVFQQMLLQLKRSFLNFAKRKDMKAAVIKHFGEVPQC